MSQIKPSIRGIEMKVGMCIGVICLISGIYFISDFYGNIWWLRLIGCILVAIAYGLSWRE